MILFPHAKINLGLFITSKREDGFHNIESCLYPVPLFDVLEILPRESFDFSVSGLIVDGDPADNLCVRAFDLLYSEYGIENVQIHLQKHIPMGAGLGGGSADAAFVLKGLNDLFELKLTSDELRNFAAELGSDCPFFVDDEPQLATGRGEQLQKFDLDLSGYFLKLIHPGIHIDTGEAYRDAMIVEETTNWDAIAKCDFNHWKEALRNNFEPGAFAKYPVLQNIKKELYDEGALYASMSGSGSAMFGIFKEAPHARGKYDFEKILRF